MSNKDFFKFTIYWLESKKRHILLCFDEFLILAFLLWKEKEF